MMRFPQPGNPEPHMRFAFPLLETRKIPINRTGKQEERLMKMHQGLKNRNLFFSDIKCICLYVCGIKSKLLLPEFIQLITSHDICILIETKTDKYDILNIPDGFS
jgi:hypothetical protein